MSLPSIYEVAESNSVLVSVLFAAVNIIAKNNLVSKVFIWWTLQDYIVSPLMKRGKELKQGRNQDGGLEAEAIWRAVAYWLIYHDLFILLSYRIKDATTYTGLYPVMN